MCCCLFTLQDCIVSTWRLCKQHMEHLENHSHVHKLKKVQWRTGKLFCRSLLWFWRPLLGGRYNALEPLCEFASREVRHWCWSIGKAAAIRESKLIRSAGAICSRAASSCVLVFNTNATNNTDEQWWMFCWQPIDFVRLHINRSHSSHVYCTDSPIFRESLSKKKKKLSVCDNTSLRGFKRYTYSSTFFCELPLGAIQAMFILSRVSLQFSSLLSSHIVMGCFLLPHIPSFRHKRSRSSSGSS